MAMNLKHKGVLQNLRDTDHFTTPKLKILHLNPKSLDRTMVVAFISVSWHLPHLQSTVSVGCVVWGFLQGRIPWPEGRAQHLENCTLRTAEPDLKNFAEIVNIFTLCGFWSLWWNVSQILLSHPSLLLSFILFLDPANQVTWVWHQADVIADLKLPAAHCRGAGGLNFRPKMLEKIKDFTHCTWHMHLRHYDSKALPYISIPNSFPTFWRDMLPHKYFSPHRLCLSAHP